MDMVGPLPTMSLYLEGLPRCGCRKRLILRFATMVHLFFLVLYVAFNTSTLTKIIENVNFTCTNVERMNLKVMRNGNGLGENYATCCSLSFWYQAMLIPRLHRNERATGLKYARTKLFSQLRPRIMLVKSINCPVYIRETKQTFSRLNESFRRKKQSCRFRFRLTCKQIRPLKRFKWTSQLLMRREKFFLSPDFYFWWAFEFCEVFNEYGATRSRDTLNSVQGALVHQSGGTS